MQNSDIRQYFQTTHNITIDDECSPAGFIRDLAEELKETKEEVKSAQQKAMDFVAAYIKKKLSPKSDVKVGIQYASIKNEGTLEATVTVYDEKGSEISVDLLSVKKKSPEKNSISSYVTIPSDLEKKPSSSSTKTTEEKTFITTFMDQKADNETITSVQHQFEEIKIATVISPEAKHSRQENKTNSNLSILVVEDNTVNQKMLIMLLKKNGYEEIDLAENGEIALKKCAHKQYDLILMDIQMPVMNGIETTTQLRAKEYSSFIVVSSASMDSLKENEKKLFDESLPKPFDSKKLKEILLNIENGTAKYISKSDNERKPAFAFK